MDEQDALGLVVSETGRRVACVLPSFVVVSSSGRRVMTDDEQPGALAVGPLNPKQKVAGEDEATV